MRKTKQKLLPLLPPYPPINKTHFIWAGMLEMSSAFKNLTKAGMLVPIVSPFNSLVQVLQKPGEPWRMTVDYHKFNQAVLLIAAAMPDVELWLGQTCTASGMW